MIRIRSSITKSCNRYQCTWHLSDDPRATSISSKSVWQRFHLLSPRRRIPIGLPQGIRMSAQSAHLTAHQQLTSLSVGKMISCSPVFIATVSIDLLDGRPVLRSVCGALDHDWLIALALLNGAEISQRFSNAFLASSSVPSAYV